MQIKQAHPDMMSHMMIISGNSRQEGQQAYKNPALALCKVFLQKTFE